MSTHPIPSQPSRLGRRLRGAAWLVVGAFVVLFLVQNHSDLHNAWRAILESHKSWLALTALAMVIWLLNLSWLHASAQRAAGLHPGAADLIRPAIVGNALNLVTKSGGMAGLATFVADARQTGRSRGSVVAAYALAQMLGEIAFGATLLIALVLVWVDGRLSGAEIAASCVFIVYLSARVGLLAASVRSRDAVRRLHAWPRRAISALRHEEAPTIDTSGADELYDAMLLIRRERRRALPVLGHAMALEALGVLELWGAAAAVGASNSLLVAFVGYAVSVLFTIVGFLPGGIGFVEISLGAVLTSYGASIATATAAVVLYRVVELWLPLMIGSMLARSLRRTKAVPA